MPSKWSAGWAWAILAIIVVAYVVVFDLHAHLAGQQTMTGKFQDWLFDVVTGPIIFGGWIGLFAGLTFHWFAKKVR